MIKRFTTSAQKTLILSKEITLKRLEDEMTKDISAVFEATKRENIKEAKLQDGSKLVIASFDKENGRTLAMIDYKDILPNKSRAEIQKSLKQKLNKIFK